MILLNFKTYIQSTGENAIKLVRIAKESESATGIETIVCPQNIDIRDIAKIFPAHTWAQHVDPDLREKATGWFPAQIAKEAGAVGTLLNHSEHKLDPETLSATHNRCKEIGMKTLIFADSVDEAVLVSKLRPDYIGYEPPELIASPDTSVSRAKPEVIESVVKAVPGIPILVGAGVKDSQDVEVSLLLGAKGIALASAFILAEDPKMVMEELSLGFAKHQ
jgi:triosephosphate isomerase (TIM)